MKISKTLLQTILVAVTVSATVSCSKSVESKPEKNKKAKTDSTQFVSGNCPACGMG